MRLPSVAATRFDVVYPEAQARLVRFAAEDSSRWSKRSVDHRINWKIFTHPGGVQDSGTPPGCKSFSIAFRRSALRSDLRLLSRNPSGCYYPSLAQTLRYYLAERGEPFGLLHRI